jgi:hypothetical protein
VLTVALTSFVAIIDRLIEIIDRHEKINRATFVDFVAPVMVDLDTVHKDYLDSFRRYYEKLSDKSTSLSLQHPIIEDVDRDIRLSESLMLKARALSLREDLDSRLRPFAASIDAYFAVTSYEPWNAQPKVPGCASLAARAEALERNGYIQGMARNYFFVELTEIAASSLDDATKRRDALRILDESAKLLQSNFQRVFAAFSELKRRLLSPV